MKKPIKKDKKALTLFILVVPSLLIAMSSAVSDFLIRVSLQVVLLFLQLVLAKNLLDDYYGDS